MAGSSSRGNKRKRSRRLEKDTTVCLSDLPDAILIHILSFLPTKLVVSTSLLSRRWRYLWASTPNLQLDESHFKDNRDKFMSFAERALVFRGGSSLVSFSLSCRLNNDASRINTWITSAILSNVEQLSVCLYLWVVPPSFVFPSCMFGCQSLVKLDLKMMCSIRVPSMICLPRLKHLSLKLVEFADNESAEKLLSHPMLEELILYNCTWFFVTAVNVNSPKLQSLSIDDCVVHEWSKDSWLEERQVCFFGDNLKFFRYDSEFPPTQYCICGSTMQLKEVDISVSIPDNNFQDMDGPSSRYCKLLNSLSMVQNLTLTETTVHSFYLLSLCPWFQTSLPVFEHVTRLNIHGCDTIISIDSEWIKELYSRCPHLEHLNFKETIGLEVLMGERPILRPMPLCFRTHLKKVTLQSYQPESNESDDPISLLFNSAPVLEEVVIHWERDSHISDQVEELERKLNARPKVSYNCRVSIVFV